VAPPLAFSVGDQDGVADRPRPGGACRLPRDLRLAACSQRADIYGPGIIVNRNTIRKLMRSQQLHGLPGMKKLFKSKANLATAVDLVERAFDRPAPNQPA
jgi:hypothetical protein